ncbi:hypothetical protein [Salidesulfovibrio brasiliensis]|uniref:hypothetical protein n=1 Tax=Salidesulfovibrio brasiliensis TaxID=221711 RepID=UPI0006CFADE2|nr:hypothetical protein [Salidesulfovibrio brasiliensis]
MRRENNTTLALVWWLGYTAVAVWAQKLLPGVDFLAPGLVLAMQERPGLRPLLLGLFWILLQEGMGGLSFGYGVASYGFLALAFAMGRWMFEGRSVLFMCLLGVFMGVMHPLLTSGLLSLETMETTMSRTIAEGVAQAVVFPVVWWLASRFFPKGLKADGAPL